MMNKKMPTRKRGAVESLPQPPVLTQEDSTFIVTLLWAILFRMIDESRMFENQAAACRPRVAPPTTAASGPPPSTAVQQSYLLSSLELMRQCQQLIKILFKVDPNTQAVLTKHLENQEGNLQWLNKMLDEQEREESNDDDSQTA